MIIGLQRLQARILLPFSRHSFLKSKYCLIKINQNYLQIFWNEQELWKQYGSKLHATHNDYTDVDFSFKMLLILFSQYWFIDSLLKNLYCRSLSTALLFSRLLGMPYFASLSFYHCHFPPAPCFKCTSEGGKSLISVSCPYNLKGKSLYDIRQTDFQFPCVINRCFRIQM